MSPATTPAFQASWTEVNGAGGPEDLHGLPAQHNPEGGALSAHDLSSSPLACVAVKATATSVHYMSVSESLHCCRSYTTLGILQRQNLKELRIRRKA